MKTFSYVIKDETGVHTRPASLMAKEAKKFESKVKIAYENKEVNMTSLLSIMTLGIKCGDEVVVSADGNDEDKAIEHLQEFFASNI